MTDELLTPDRHYPVVEIALSEHGLLRRVVRHGAEPGDYDMDLISVELVNATEQIEEFCAAHLSKVGASLDIPTVAADVNHILDGHEPGSPRVLCDPIGNCTRCGQQVQAWDYEHGDARRVEEGHAADAFLCGESCADQFFMNYDPWEPEDRS